MLVMDLFTPSPTPPLPVRRHPPWSQFPHLPVSESTAGLVPAPLFSKRKRLVLHVTVRDLPSSPEETDPASSPTSSSSSRSTNSSAVSSPATSAPNSPSNRPVSLAYEHPPPPYESVAHSTSGSKPGSRAGWREIPRTTTSTLPIRRLRRKPSPKKESLRSLRAKDSEACLQRVYEQQLEAYLSGELFVRSKWREDLGSIAE